MITQRRLQRIRKLKELVRENERGALVRAEREVSAANEALETVRARVDALNERASLPGDVSAAELIERGFLLDGERRRETSAQHELDRREADRQSQVRVVNKASREVRSLEVLGERLSREEIAIEAKREQALSDEHGARRRAT